MPHEGTATADPTPASTRPGGAPRRPPIWILVAVSAIGPLALNIFMPSMPGLQAAFGVPYAVVQLTLTLYLIGLAVCQLAYGPLSDRFGRRPVLLAGLVLFVVASLAAAVAPTIEALIAARLLQAIGGASGIVLSRAIVRDLYGREKSASIIGYITMAWVVAPMLAPSIGGALDELAGWRASFYLLAGLGLVVLAAGFRRLHETHHHRVAGGEGAGLLAGYACLLRQPRFNAYALTLGFTSSAFFSFLAGAPYLMVEVLGRSPLEYGLWFVLTSLGYMLGNGLAGRFSEALGVDRMITLGTLAALAGTTVGLGLGLAGLLSPAAIFVPMLLVALGNGLAIPNGIAGAISINPTVAGAAAGLAGFLQMALGAATSQSVGFLQTAWPLAMFYVMAAGTTLAVVAHLLAVVRLPAPEEIAKDAAPPRRYAEGAAE